MRGVEWREVEGVECGGEVISFFAKIIATNRNIFPRGMPVASDPSSVVQQLSVALSDDSSSATPFFKKIENHSVSAVS